MGFVSHLMYTYKAFLAALRPHVFLAPGVISSPKGKPMERYPGTEIDFTAGYRINSDCDIKLCYSQIIATASMEAIKGGGAGTANNWAWVMVTINPILFSSPKVKKNQDLE